MKLFKYFLVILSTLIISNCASNDDQLMKKANELAQKFIITDGHIDLPWRLHKGGYEDISVRTPGGDFDYVRSKEGGLDAPFMSIYVPATYQVTGGAKAFLLLWKNIPKYKYLYFFFKTPIIFSLFSFFYEIIAYFLYLKNKDQLSR